MPSITLFIFFGLIRFRAASLEGPSSVCVAISAGAAPAGAASVAAGAVGVRGAKPRAVAAAVMSNEKS